MRIDGFEGLAAEFEDLSLSFEQMAERHGRKSARQAIETGVDRAMDDVVTDAKTRVPKDTGRLARSIDHESRGWHGDRYRHAYGSTLQDEYARVQEFGTRKKNYEIRPNGNYPLRFVWESPPPGAPYAPGEEVRFQYVVHPGVTVEQPGPMQSALNDHTQAISGHIGRSIQETMEDGLD